MAFLRDSDENFWEYFEQSTQDAPDPRSKLLAFFQALQNYVTSPECYGCPFINIAVEYPQPAYPGHQVALGHKQAVRLRFQQLAQEAGASQPEALANALFLLMDGAYMASRMFGASPDNPASAVALAAQQLIDVHLPIKAGG